MPSSRLKRQSEAFIDVDHCDDCGCVIPLTGDSLCLTCREDAERRHQCPVCGQGPVMYLVAESRPDTCSTACEESWERGA